MLWVLVSLAFAQAPELAGVWATPGMSIALDADGTVLWTLGNQQAHGTWTAADGLLTIAVNGAVTVYSFTLQGDALQVVDARGIGAVLQRQAAPAAPPSGPVLTADEVLELLEHYRTLDPSVVHARLYRLPPDVGEMMSFYGALTEDLWYRVCQGPDAPAVTYGGGCAVVVNNRQQSAQLLAQMGIPDDGGQAPLDAANVATWYRCKTGALDEATCATWLQVQSNVSQMQHDTSMQIIENMGNSGCTEHYEAGTNRYLGCW